MYLLDTNVVSEIRRHERADRYVRAWAEQSPAELFWLSAITVFEIELGILRLERTDRFQAAHLRDWLERQVLVRFEARILAIDTPVARCCAALHVPDPRPERDAMIAATAIVHGLTVATRNVADFRRMNVPVVNPWDDPSA